MTNNLLLKIKGIKSKTVLIVGSGSSIGIYKEKILSFVKKNKVIVFGCNNMSEIIVPNYHFWTDSKRYIKYGHLINNKSIPIFSKKFRNKNIIKLHWNKPYGIVRFCSGARGSRYRDPKNKRYYNVPIKYDTRTGMIKGYFKTVGTLAIIYVYLKKAAKIFVAGMDGYSFHSRESLDNKNCSQHCYTKGHSIFDDEDDAKGKDLNLTSKEKYKRYIQKSLERNGGKRSRPHYR